MLILSRNLISESLLAAKETDAPVSFPLFSLDGGDGFLSADLVSYQRQHQTRARGMLALCDDQTSSGPQEIPDDIDVMIVAMPKATNDIRDPANHDSYLYKAWVRGPENVEVRLVQIVEFDEEIFSRVRGLYETDVLRAKRVLVVGVGSGGSVIAVELAKAGVGSLTLVDHDRLEVANIVRHICGLSDLGRFKTKAVRDQILDKNPSADVETFEDECDWQWLSKLKELVRRADLVFCCTDNRPSRILVNLACVSEGRVCIYGGTFNRAYGGHVLRVIPGLSMCYQCFIDLLPEKAEDQEIATQEQANRIAYDDRQVPVEPGLANDIAPISNMCVKLGLLEMLRGTETTLANLYEDLSNAWYQWLNRREANTDYAGLQPMDSGDSDGFRILAWYGIANEKNPGCPVCGDFIGQAVVTGAHAPSRERIDAFAPDAINDTAVDESFPPPDHSEMEV